MKVEVHQLKSIRKFYQRRFVTPLRYQFPERLYWYGVKNYFYLRCNKKLRYSSVSNINEKLMWLSRYWQHPLKTLCADKYLVRDYIVDLGLQDILIPIIETYENPQDIDFDSLPNKFVIKCNHGCRLNLICEDKSNLDLDMTKNTLHKYINKNYGFSSYEIHYSKIKRKIICQHFLAKEPKEIQVFCINGKPHSFLIMHKLWNNEWKRCSYSLDWKRASLLKGEDTFSIAPMSKPKRLDDILKYSLLLSKPFPFVRVDFFCHEEEIYFCELTFSPRGNVLDLNTDYFIEDLGKKLKLPRPYLF